MIIAASVLLASLSTQDATPLLQLEGACEYPENVREVAARDGTRLWFCEKATVLHDGNEARFQFDLPVKDTVTFIGTLKGDRMDIVRFASRSRPSRDATGSCKIERANGRIKVIACTAATGGRFHAVNFVPERR